MLILKTFCIVLFLLSISCENIVEESFTGTGAYKEYANRIEEFLKEDNDISSTCTDQMEEYKNGLISKKLWALRSK